MPYGPDGATPRNLRTQCENVDVENQTTGPQDHWTRPDHRTGLGVHTSDPLLKVVEWIAWLTEVSYFQMRDVINTSSFYTDFSNYHWICAPSASAYSTGVSWLWIIFVPTLGWWCRNEFGPLLLVGHPITTTTSWDPAGKGG